MHLGFTQLADTLYGDGRLTRPERIAASSAVGDALAAFVAGIEAKAPELYQRDRWSSPDGADTGTTEALTVEASAEQTRDAIEQAVQAAYCGGEQHTYTWVADYDPDAGLVWFRTGGDDQPSATWQQSYTSAGAAITLTGDRVEVRPRTVYEPVTGPAVEAPVTTQEAHDPPLFTDGGAVPPAGSTAPEAATTAKEIVMTAPVIDAATREADEAAARVRTAEALELARYRVADQARGLVDAKLAESELPATAQNRVRAQFTPTALPLLEADGKSLDTAKLTTTIEAAVTAEKAYVAELLESHGVGRVAGAGVLLGAATGIPASFGAATSTREADTATVEALVTEYTNRGMSPEAARAAAVGRN
jgi:hypothetical protein